MFDKGMFKNMDMGSCCSMMAKLMNPGSKEGTAGALNVKNCGQMMKQCCPEGKFDLQSCRSMMAKFFEGEHNKEKEP